MKLTSVEIKDYKSIRNSTPFEVGQITCLVGKNEAGKSAILSALACLNPHPATPQSLQIERDYPRRYLTEYKIRHPKLDILKKHQLQFQQIGNSRQMRFRRLNPCLAVVHSKPKWFN